VEKVQAAFVLISGKRDNTWSTTEMSAQIIHRLAAMGCAYHYKRIACDTGHNNYLPKAECLQEIYAFLKSNYV
jgi:hypothetical protein